MIRPQKSKVHQKLLNWFLDRKFKKSFSSVNVNIDFEINDQKSVLVIGNHSTWWDGFLIYQLNRQIIKKDFYAMMLETQLSKLWFLQKVGCFSINPGSKSVVESLKFGSDLLTKEQNMLLFYPQGRFFSLFDENWAFNKGLDFMLKNQTETEILFYSLFTDFGSNEKPYLNVYLEKVPDPQTYSYLQLELAYKKFYQQSKLKHIAHFRP